MLDASTVALSLTFFGTLGVAFLLFVGQFLAFTVLLGLAALGQLLSYAVRVMRPGETT